MKKTEKKPELTISEMGKKGGLTTRKKLGKEHYSRISREGWKKRKAAKAQTT